MDGSEKKKIYILLLTHATSYLYWQCMHGPNCKIGNFCTVGRRLQEVNVLGGLILPVWGAVEKALSKQVLLQHKSCQELKHFIEKGLLIKLVIGAEF